MDANQLGNEAAFKKILAKAFEAGVKSGMHSDEKYLDAELEFEADRFISEPEIDALLAELAKERP